MEEFLADPDNPIHNSDIRRLNLQLFDIVVNNLYPFEKVSEDPKSSHEEIIENIDIGGPSMLKAAAKNFKRMIVSMTLKIILIFHTKTNK